MVGIVTRSNLMHAMVSLARVAQPAAADDATIRERLLAEMQKEQWAPVAMINVVVRDGVVELWGVIVDERQREALKVAAENIPGVKAVKDHLVWVEPTSGMIVLTPDEQATAHYVRPTHPQRSERHSSFRQLCPAMTDAISETCFTSQASRYRIPPAARSPAVRNRRNSRARCA